MTGWSCSGRVYVWSLCAAVVVAGHAPALAEVGGSLGDAIDAIGQPAGAAEGGEATRGGSQARLSGSSGSGSNGSGSGGSASVGLERGGRGALDLEQPADELEATPVKRFGAQDTMMAVFGVGGAIDGRGSTDLEGFAQLTWFIVDDVELGAELGVWHFGQDGDDAVGGSIAALLRWHFVNEDRLSLFVDGGLGLLGATDEVPEDGTELNFLPRAGLGATYRPWDGNLRVMGGVRWHHISNARSSGAEDNPSRDGAMVYVGICVPF